MTVGLWRLVYSLSLAICRAIWTSGFSITFKVESYVNKMKHWNQISIAYLGIDEIFRWITFVAVDVQAYSCTGTAGAA